MKTFVCDIDEVLVHSGVMDAARSGANSAKLLLRHSLLNRMVRRGALQADDDKTVVSLRELAGMGIVDCVVVNPES